MNATPSSSPTRVPTLGSIVLAILLATALAPAVTAQERPWSLAVTATDLEASGLADGEQDDVAFGLEGAYRFSNRWRLAARLTNGTLTGVDPRIFCILLVTGPNCAEYDVDVWSAELTARYVLYSRDRFELYALAGIGLYTLELHLAGSSDSNDALTQHLGLGAEIDLGPRAFLRPELRRRFASEPNFAVIGLDSKVDLEQDVELGLAFGFRL